jgi:hypothetical protein
MAVTPLEYDDIVDIRFDPWTNAGQGEFEPLAIGYGANPAEVRNVPNTAPYEIKLYEAPQLNSPSTTVITQTTPSLELVEVGQSVTPGSGQYRVVYYDDLGMGLIQFHEDQKGKEVSIKYYGLGHLIQKISLDTRVPDTGNTTIDGYKTFIGGVKATTNDLTKIAAFERTSSSTSVARFAAKIIHKTSGNMIDGHGVDLALVIQDSAGVENEIGLLEGVRDGADNTGKVTLVVYAAGVKQNSLVAYSDGRIQGVNGIVTKQVDLGTSGAPTDAELDGAFGQPSALGAGFIGVLHDTIGGLAYICVTNAAAEWYYVATTLA